MDVFIHRHNVWFFGSIQSSSLLSPFSTRSTRNPQGYYYSLIDSCFGRCIPFWADTPGDGRVGRREACTCQYYKRQKKSISLVVRSSPLMIESHVKWWCAVSNLRAPTRYYNGRSIHLSAKLGERERETERARELEEHTYICTIVGTPYWDEQCYNRNV